MTPLAAGMAVVFAVGAFCLPGESGAKVQDPARQALMAKRQELMQSRISGDTVAAAALRTELKALHRDIRGKQARPAVASGAKASLSSLRDTLAQRADLRAQLRETLEAKSLRRLETLRARWADATPARNAAAGSKAVIQVTNCNDDGAGSLRDAVANANTGDEIDLTSLACSTITLTSGGIWVDQDDLTITGPGAGALTIDADENGTVFDFAGTGTLSISGATLTNGYYYDYSGGAIWAKYGDVVLQDATISNSEVFGYSDIGGAAVFAYEGSITLTNSTVTGNDVFAASYDEQSPIASGALVSKYGSITLTDSTVSGNTAYGDGIAVGAGMFAQSVTLNRSTVSGNRAGSAVTPPGPTQQQKATQVPMGSPYLSLGLGGGILSGVASITASTISGNEALAGAGLVALSSLDLVNSTISGNAAYAAAGVIAGADVVTLANSTITANHAMGYAGGMAFKYSEGGSVTMNSTIVSGNTGALAADLMFDPENESLLVIAGAANLVGDAENITLPGDTLAADPLLGALANNGGPTQTHALGAGSPAIDAGNNVAMLATDQRGGVYSRVMGAAADIGAFEVQGGADPGPGPGDYQPAPLNVPTTSAWALGLLGTLLGFFGWRQGWFASTNRRRE
ncbi:right-handed parallel beta-helix repeat-containing protein [Xanthomonadaceae bacterium JHOS43]|nr:right-handed parallel beta-helix repeat-containing protein [Xanthomonadaceae bacterium JHOS43]